MSYVGIYNMFNTILTCYQRLFSFTDVDVTNHLRTLLRRDGCENQRFFKHCQQTKTSITNEANLNIS